MNKVLIIVGVIVVIIIAICFGTYNKLINLDEGVTAQWANVETVLQRRFDLIPNLVNTVKGFADHETEVFTKVTELRSQWAAAGTANEKVAVANEMQGALGRMMLVAENYPQLKSNTNFLALQDELAGTENRISVERRRYNDAIRSYNSAIRRIPGNLFAGGMGLEARTPFEASEAAVNTVPSVEF
jgi:LemA protein